MIYHTLLDERLDLGIMECLMYEGFGGDIKLSEKRGDKLIYAELAVMEKDYGIKL